MNKTLICGILITLLMAATAIFGPFLTLHDVTDKQEIQFVTDDKGNSTILAPPLPPSADYPFGTDAYGYDLMTKMLIGAKYSLFLSVAIALVRVVIGGTLGMIAGYFSKPASRKRQLPAVWKALNGIPVFLVVWLLLSGISINTSLSMLQHSIWMGVVLAIIGIPSIVSSVKDKTAIIKEKPFILASRSVGAGHGKIIRSHLLPHLKESLTILAVQEVVLVLTVFGQLSVFHLFVGGTTMTFDPIEFNSRTQEWSGLIAIGRNKLEVWPWMLFIPLAGYLILILGFQLLSKGLEKLYNLRYTKPSQL